MARLLIISAAATGLLFLTSLATLAHGGASSSASSSSPSSSSSSSSSSPAVGDGGGEGGAKNDAKQCDLDIIDASSWRLRDFEAARRRKVPLLLRGLLKWPEQAEKWRNDPSELAREHGDLRLPVRKPRDIKAGTFIFPPDSEITLSDWWKLAEASTRAEALRESTTADSAASAASAGGVSGAAEDTTNSNGATISTTAAAPLPPVSPHDGSGTNNVAPFIFTLNASTGIVARLGLGLPPCLSTLANKPVFSLSAHASVSSAAIIAASGASSDTNAAAIKAKAPGAGADADANANDNGRWRWRQGLDMHQHEEAWLGLVVGTKDWLIASPRTSPPSAGDWAHITAHDARTAEKAIRGELSRPEKLLTCRQRAGEIIYLPDAWHHSTYNVDARTPQQIRNGIPALTLGVGGNGRAPAACGAVAFNDLAALRAMPKKALKRRTVVGLTALHAAASTAAVSFFVDRSNGNTTTDSRVRPETGGAAVTAQEEEERAAPLFQVDDPGGQNAHTPLLTATIRGDLSVVRALVARGASVWKVRGIGGATAVHFAARAGGPDLIAFLVEQSVREAKRARAAGAGASASSSVAAAGNLAEKVQREMVMSRDSIGRTPLHWAAESGSVENVRALLHLGADPLVTTPANPDLRTPDDNMDSVMEAVRATGAFTSSDRHIRVLEYLEGEVGIPIAMRPDLLSIAPECAQTAPQTGCPGMAAWLKKKATHPAAAAATAAKPPHHVEL